MDRLRFKTARQAEIEAAPIRQVAGLLGVDSDSERAISRLARGFRLASAGVRAFQQRRSAHN
jgi:hypothetical protein